MPNANTPVMDFLLTRRSRPYKILTPPVPDHAALMPILTAAARTPDHGKLVPWRFIVLERAALVRLGALVEERGAALGRDTAEIDKARAPYDMAHLAVAVIATPQVSEKIPRIEQTYAAGAACLALLNAALASGWGANWLSGWPVYDRAFVEAGLGLKEHESVAGLIHIGTATSVPPDRPRPDLDAITTWIPT